MSVINTKQKHQTYLQQELDLFQPLLKSAGYRLNVEQPHISGERFLMQAVTTTSGRKLILLGVRESDGQQVVIKATSDPSGIAEIEHERQCREVLHKINFAYNVFFSPEEVFYAKQSDYVISIQKCIQQKTSFLQRPLTEQFDFALQAFKAQESAHATTHRHIRTITKTFGIQNADGYLASFKDFITKIDTTDVEKKIVTDLKDTYAVLCENKTVIDQYCGFLTHVDFVPHNFRISEDTMYLLDYSSLRFGNKYEGWARFVNFMTLHNPPLAQALSKYVKDNRTPEETLSLKMMRLYRLGEIICYYSDKLSKCEGDLLLLNTARVHFWHQVLLATTLDATISHETLIEYTNNRDSLRSSEEKKRQIGLH